MKFSKNSILGLCCLSLFVFSPLSKAAVLVEERGRSVNTSKANVLTSSESYLSAHQLRSTRRVSVGAQFGGSVGAAGLGIELSFAPQSIAVIQFGGGTSMQSFGAAWKYVFGGTSLAPYSQLGYSHWFGGSEEKKPIQRTSPSFLADRLLTKEEKAAGKFSKDLAVGGFGLQYYQLNGPYVGVSLFAEVDLLLDVTNPNPLATGALGLQYFF